MEIYIFRHHPKQEPAIPAPWTIQLADIERKVHQFNTTDSEGKQESSIQAS